jgi:hypothetical protein
MHGLRDLVRREVLPGELDQCFGLDILLQNDDGRDRLDPLFVREADDGYLCDSGMGVQRPSG